MCKTWEVLPDFFSPLCSAQFMPSLGSPSCPICVSPVRNNEADCLYNTCTGTLGEYLALNLGTSLSEAAHVYPRTQGGGTSVIGGVSGDFVYDWYDKYATAAEISEPVSLKYIGVADFGCRWVYERRFVRYYKRTGSYVAVAGVTGTVGKSEVEYTDVDLDGPGPYTSPYTCSGLLEKCTSVGWGWKWSFTISNNASPSGIRASLFLERTVARHVIQRYTEGPFFDAGVQTVSIPSASSPGPGMVPERSYAPNIPSIVGYTFGPSPGRWEAFPSLNDGSGTARMVPNIGVWSTGTGDNCDKRRPWTLIKTYDAIDGYPEVGGVAGEDSYDSITNLPKYIRIGVGKL